MSGHGSGDRITVHGGLTTAETAAFRERADALERARSAVASAREALVTARGVVADPWADALGPAFGAWWARGSVSTSPGPLAATLLPAVAEQGPALAGLEDAAVRAAALVEALAGLRDRVLRAGQLLGEADRGASSTLRSVALRVLPSVALAAVAGAVTGELAAAARGHRVPSPWAMVHRLGPDTQDVVVGLSPLVAALGPGTWTRLALPGGAITPLVPPPGAGGPPPGALGTATDAVGDLLTGFSGTIGARTVTRELTQGDDGAPLAPLAPPRGIRDVLASLDVVARTAPGTVAVQQVGTPGHPTFVLLVPGTQTVLPSTNPLDLLTDVDLMEGEQADVVTTAVAALELAGADADTPVLLAGYSLGGIAAARMAASPALRARFRVTGLVTAGSPVAHIPVPRGLRALHVENSSEGVSALDGADNPAGDARVTVHADLGDDRYADLSSPEGRAAASGHALATHLGVLDEAAALGDPALDRALADLDAQVATREGATTRTWYVQGERSYARGVDPVGAVVDVADMLTSRAG